MLAEVAAEALASLSAKVRLLELKELRALASFKPVSGGSDVFCVNGERGKLPLDRDLAEAAKWMVQRVRTERGFVPDLTALPFAEIAQAQAGTGGPEVEQLRAKREASLTFHAEKKALAYQLRQGVALPCVSVNICMCADCHNCFKHASGLWEREIRCTEEQSKRLHVFAKGVCSCGDQRFRRAI